MGRLYNSDARYYDYKVVCAVGLLDLEVQVKRLFKKEYSCQGGVSCDGNYYYQAMEKVEF